MAVVAFATALVCGAGCKASPTRTRNADADFRCPASRPQAFDYCGLPDATREAAAASDCVPWPVRPPAMWMAFCCPEPEDESGIGPCR